MLIVGSSVGAKAGLWILAALGLKSLAEYFIDGLPRLLEHYYAGFTLAWKTGKDPVSDRFMHEQSFQVSVASSRIADGRVAITLLLLSAITAYLLRANMLCWNAGNRSFAESRRITPQGQAPPTDPAKRRVFSV